MQNHLIKIHLVCYQNQELATPCKKNKMPISYHLISSPLKQKEYPRTPKVSHFPLLPFHSNKMSKKMQKPINKISINQSLTAHQQIKHKEI
ncbi:hypothetical protein PRUPE_3G195200 [Prunus persica]|uniref:Uncharacterized protein n=1 Tax=Prunus persica TaxID=3760 RepID=A0A251Q2R0_PRUPE|nr:hypothetical protein PRUPE_3G195200 [Prunus persica]